MSVLIVSIHLAWWESGCAQSISVSRQSAINKKQLAINYVLVINRDFSRLSDNAGSCQNGPTTLGLTHYQLNMDDKTKGCKLKQIIWRIKILLVYSSRKDL